MTIFETRLVDLDAERPTDWCYTRGSLANLRVGPFSFGVNTADGLTFWFGIGKGESGWSWTLSVVRR